MLNTAFVLKFTTPGKLACKLNAVFIIFAFDFPLVCTFMHHICTEQTCVNPIYCAVFFQQYLIGFICNTCSYSGNSITRWKVYLARLYSNQKGDLRAQFDSISIFKVRFFFFGAVRKLSTIVRWRQISLLLRVDVTVILVSRPCFGVSSYPNN